MPAKLRLAEAYVRDRSAWLDFRILAATATGILGWRWIPSPYEAVPT
jgi:lipopolysaccharide/colanic/teichoic acid biosynthesis glycosyltransferase